MSKSLGNIILVKDLSNEYHGEVIRLALMSSHYRQGLDWNAKVVHQAKKLLDKLGRPSFQIGHHMIVLGVLEGGGHRIKLTDGPIFSEPDSKMALNEWIDLVIEYQLGKIKISVNGYSKTYEHEKVTIVNPKDKYGPRFTFKGGPESRILFDFVHLWECQE